MIALSAAWRSAPERSGAEVLDPLLALLSRLPFSGIVLDGGVGARAIADVRAYLARREVPLPLFRGAVGAPPPPPERRGLPPPRLCATAEDERSAAVADLSRTLELASELEVPVVTVSAGAVDPDPRCARRDRAFTEPEAVDLQRAARAASPVRRLAMDGLRFAMEALCRRAEPLGVRVAIENPALPLELPSPEELHRLFADLRGLPLGYAHDVGAARLCKELGGPPGRELLDAGRDGLCAVFLCDARDRETGLVPGRGGIDFRGLARAIPAEVTRVLAPAASWSERDVEEGYETLVGAGW